MSCTTPARPRRPHLRRSLLALVALMAGIVRHPVAAAQTPGNDFFGYANAAWLQAATIPAGRERWGARDEIAALTRTRMTALLEGAAHAPAGSLARKVADYRAAYLDERTIDARGLAPLQPLLAPIDRIDGRPALTRALGAGMLADVDPMNWGVYRSASLLGLAVEEGLNGERTNVPFLVQGGLGLPDREPYLGDDSAMVVLRARYRRYIARMFTLAGLDQADARADRVLTLETAIARSQATREASAQDHNADSLWTRSDFARRAPGMDWALFFDAAGLGHEERFIAWQPSALIGVAALVAARPLEEWKDYLRFRAIDRYADLLPRELRDEALAFHAPAAASRADRALAATQGALGQGIGRLYVERYFPPAQKARVRRVVDDVVAAFARRVEGASWMTPATRAIALEKVRTLYVGIGYPERWQDYAGLTVDPDDALGNARRAEARACRQALERLGRPVDRHEWWITPQTAGAILIFQLNAYDFTAALLVPPKFDSAGSDAAAYGAIGAIIGHDVSHYVDLLGADYDLQGAARRWWTAEDLARFDTLTRPLVEQFAAYRPLPDATIDGLRSRSENVADLAGLVAAFDAYRATLGARARDSAYIRARDREFFIAFAQGWRSVQSEAGLRAQLGNDNHAPDRYRVALVRNLDAWYAAFDVTPGDALYLAPADRVRIW